LMTKYTYFCERCRSTFEVEIENEEQGIPTEAACPKCGYAHAVKLFAAPAAQPAGGCAPDSGC